MAAEITASWERMNVMQTEFKTLPKKLCWKGSSTWGLETIEVYVGVWPQWFSSLSPRSILECEKLVKATYRRNGLVYRESSSEDEGVEGSVLSSEVIEIDDDDDDDVIAVGCCKLCRSCISLQLQHENNQVIKDLLLFCSSRCFSGSSKEAGSAQQRSSGEHNKLCCWTFDREFMSLWV